MTDFQALLLFIGFCVATGITATYFLAVNLLDDAE